MYQKYRTGKNDLKCSVRKSILHCLQMLICQNACRKKIMIFINGINPNSRSAYVNADITGKSGLGMNTGDFADSPTAQKFVIQLLMI